MQGRGERPSASEREEWGEEKKGKKEENGERLVGCGSAGPHQPKANVWHSATSPFADVWHCATLANGDMAFLPRHQLQFKKEFPSTACIIYVSYARAMYIKYYLSYNINLTPMYKAYASFLFFFFFV